MAEGNPKLKGIVLAGHGLFTWGDTAKECYRQTLRIIQNGGRLAGGERKAPSRSASPWRSPLGDGRKTASWPARPRPAGELSSGAHKVRHFTTRRRCWSL